MWTKFGFIKKKENISMWKNANINIEVEGCGETKVIHFRNLLCHDDEQNKVCLCQRENKLLPMHEAILITK